MRTALVIVILLVLGAGGWLVYQRNLDQQSTTVAAIEVQSVSVQPVRTAPMVDSIASYGNLVAARSVDIVPETAGTVRQILFDDGQAVTAGTPLIVMDNSIAQAQLQSARAQAETDLQNLRRTQSLSHQGLDSTYSLEQAQSRAAASQADVQINERRVSQATLKAPFAGTLGSSRIDVGAFVTSADVIVTLQDTANLEIEFRMPSSVALQVSAGMPVHIQVPGTATDRRVDGKLTFIDPAISTDTRSVQLRAVVHNVQQLRPGLYVRVSLDLQTDPKALVVPVGAISNDLANSYVFVVDDKNIAHQRTVTVGLTDGVRTQLTSGVKEGDQVVTIGQFRLRDGDAVKIVPAPTDVQGAT